MGYVPSGLFIPAKSGPYYTIANPMPAQPAQVATFANTLSVEAVPAKIRTIETQELAKYAESVTAVAKQLRLSKPDLVIVPLRGALKPWRHIEAMCLQELKACILESSGLGAGRANTDKLHADLREALKAFDRDERIHVAVVDTAKGGNGCDALARLLQSVADSLSLGNICVLFHLIVTNDAEAPKTLRALTRFTTARFACDVRFYTVDSLLVEDWEPAYGLCAIRDDGTRMAVKLLAASSHQLGVREREHCYVLESSRMCDVVNHLVSECITMEMITDPRLIQIDDLSIKRATSD